ncbi:MAG: DUF3822 family protein [Bacteroidetes bacterium]|nr:DUF3822 family protein [Bacteroidota bacterium]
MSTRVFSPSLSIADPQFDPAHCEKYCLVLQAGDDQFAFAVLDNIANEFLAFEHYRFAKINSEKNLAEQIEKLATEHEWLHNGFKRADAMIITERFTLVPSGFYDRSKQKEFLSFNHPPAEKDVLLHDELKNTDAVNVYSVDAPMEKALEKIAKGIRMHHHLTPLIEKTIAVNKNKKERRALASVQPGRFDLVISEGGKLLLANTFSFQTSEDFIYYLLFSCEQLKMNSDQLELEIVGETENDSAIALMARKYVRNVSFGSRPAGANFAAGFSQIPAHYFHSLFSLPYFS